MLFFGLLLRSFVAPGYMLDTKPSNGDLFSVILCSGPAGINAIDAIQPLVDSHSDHQHNDSVSDHKHHDNAAQEHASSTCGFWSTSSQLLVTEVDFFAIPEPALQQQVILYQTHSSERSLRTNHTVRAPPISPLV